MGRAMELAIGDSPGATADEVTQRKGALTIKLRCFRRGYELMNELQSEACGVTFEGGIEDHNPFRGCHDEGELLLQ